MYTNKKRKNKKAKNAETRNLILTTIIVIFATLLGCYMAFNIYLSALPPIENFSDYNHTPVAEVLSSDDEIIRTFSAYKSIDTPLDEVPENLVNALLATEDKNFYEHKGYDIFALVRSILTNITAGKVKQGASTITQQLARILFLSNERTFDRKIKELIIASRIEKTIPKQRILELYLNKVYLGEGSYGVGAAAEVYFNKKPSKLSLSECALIAGLPQAPSVYSPYKHMDLAVKRRAKVLKRMRAMGYITEEQEEKANAVEIKIDPNRRAFSLNKAPYFIDLVMSEIKDAGFDEDEIINGGYKIYTTLNYKDQEAARDALVGTMKARGLNKPEQQAALMSIDAVSGKILAYIGGKDYSISQFDRVRLAVRQPGSSFKVFVYTTAMEKGKNPNDIYLDSPFKIGDWSPRNYGNKYRGAMPLYAALATSSNVIATRLIMDVGVYDVINMARRLGITTPIPNDATIALGSGSVKLFEMTTAYGALANGGTRVKPYAIEKIETATGRVVYTASPKYERVLNIETVAKMVDMMKRVITSGTGKAANIGRPAAGKTGTTNNYKDAWFIGFTPNIVTGVWVGNDRNQSLGKITGGSIPAVIWKKYMLVATKDWPIEDFNYPEIIIDKKFNFNSTSNEEAPDESSSEEIDVNQTTQSQENQENAQPQQTTSEAPVPKLRPATSTKNNVIMPPIPTNREPLDVESY